MSSYAERKLKSALLLLTGPFFLNVDVIASIPSLPANINAVEGARGNASNHPNGSHHDILARTTA
jgi:hypothetical protein